MEDPLETEAKEKESVVKVFVSRTMLCFMWVTMHTVRAQQELIFGKGTRISIFRVRWFTKWPCRNPCQTPLSLTASLVTENPIFHWKVLRRISFPKIGSHQNYCTRLWIILELSSRNTTLALTLRNCFGTHVTGAMQVSGLCSRLAQVRQDVYSYALAIYNYTPVISNDTSWITLTLLNCFGIK